MNYRHIYHAGNFADVYKHCILTMLIEELKQKESPFCYLDTHAGIGIYDLSAQRKNSAAGRTRNWQKQPDQLCPEPICEEHTNGIDRIYDQITNLSPIKTYQDIVKGKNQHTAKLHFYPGSPAIVRALLRPQDAMILSELHPEDAATLKKYFAHDRRVAVHHTDGYQSIKAFLSPKTGRGLILIDPPFEQPNEFQKIACALTCGLQKFPHGIYLLWFPIKNTLPIKKFYQELTSLPCKNILLIETSIGKNPVTCLQIACQDVTQLDSQNKNENRNNKLMQCGMAIINYPWQFEKKITPILNWLNKKLAVDSSAHYNVIDKNH